MEAEMPSSPVCRAGPPAAASPVSATTSWRRQALWMVPLLLAAPVWLQAVTSQSPTYPATRRDDVVDDYHGTKVGDPYRWLEQLDSPGTVDWVQAQRRFTSDQLARIPEREALRERLTALWNYRRTDVPW